MSKAIYALSGDPITLGHIDIIKRSSLIFEEVIVAIGHNSDKNYLFNLSERVSLAEQSLISYSNVIVKSFEGLLVDFAYKEKADVIIRGIRNSTDFEFEFNINKVNNTQIEIETFLLFTNSKLSHISSSNVKSLIKENGFVHEYVSLPVKKSLEEKINSQKIIGLTGLMGTGKSWISEQLELYSQNKDIAVHNIDLDVIAKEISISKEKGYLNIQNKIKEHFGTLDRNEISKIVFDKNKGYNNPDLHFLNSVYKNAVNIEIRKKIRNKKGIIILNSAILVESDFLPVCNNNIVLIKADNDFRFNNTLNGRGISKSEIENRSLFVLSNFEKEEAIKRSIEKHNYGNLLIYENHENIDIAQIYNNLIEI